MKNQKKYFDLYGLEVVRQMLIKKGFTHFCYTRRSFATMGSPTFKIEDVKMNEDMEIIKTVNHRDGAITVITHGGYLKFIKI